MLKVFQRKKTRKGAVIQGIVDVPDSEGFRSSAWTVFKPVCQILFHLVSVNWVTQCITDICFVFNLREMLCSIFWLCEEKLKSIVLLVLHLPFLVQWRLWADHGWHSWEHTADALPWCFTSEDSMTLSLESLSLLPFLSARVHVHDHIIRSCSGNLDSSGQNCKYKDCQLSCSSSTRG
jgi:hypothetical protein